MRFTGRSWALFRGSVFLALSVSFVAAQVCIAQDGFSDQEIRNEAKIRTIASNYNCSLPKGKMGAKFEEQVVEFVYANNLNSYSNLDGMMMKTGGVGRETFLRAISRVLRGEGRYGAIDITSNETKLFDLISDYISKGTIPPKGIELSLVAAAIENPGFCNGTYFKRIQALANRYGQNGSATEREKYRQLLSRKCNAMKAKLDAQGKKDRSYERKYRSLLDLQNALNEPAEPNFFHFSGDWK